MRGENFMNQEKKQQFQDIANSVRSLSMDAIQKANSGHPGLPLGCAEIGAVLYGEHLRYNPEDLNWMNRDRFVLSAGHGSMFLYSLLHLSGCGLKMDDLKNFRQFHSITPGHPEVHETPGVEMTTGPLGQGLATAVGMALAGKMLADRFNEEDISLFDYQVITLAGDGCIMEGISSEASSFAGHLGLDNLVILYDSNDISLDGDLSECFSEDVAKRYEAYGFDVRQVDGHDLNALSDVLAWSRLNNKKPKLIICKTVIGKGSPNKQGTSECHGSPLGDSEISLTKQGLGLPQDQKFFVVDGVYEYFNAHGKNLKALYTGWQEKLSLYQKKYPTKYALLQQMQNPDFSDLEARMPKFEVGSMAAGRKVSSLCLNAIAKSLPGFIGGSADLSCSDSTELMGEGFVTRENFSARNIKYGVREFAMGAIASGLSLSGFFKPFVGTFLCFSDYVRPAIRLAALCGIDVSYQFTHDSILLGEDGPTHQPVEHAAALRTIPNLLVFRPADGNETRAAWLCGMTHKGPKAYLLSRQNLPQLALTDRPYQQGVNKGAYVLMEEDKNRELDLVIFSSGSELHLAVQAGEKLKTMGKNLRIVSVPCVSLFEKQDKGYQNEVLAHSAKNRVAIEAQVSFGWHRFVGINGLILSQDQFGLSAPQKALAEHFGFTVDAVVSRILGA
ncbi:MAG: transketolase [Candidatus Cloacimonetes bacterium]|nr:transketolase [Candidatus Cloacimonadota bacterium]